MTFPREGKFTSRHFCLKRCLFQICYAVNPLLRGKPRRSKFSTWNALFLGPQNCTFLGREQATWRGKVLGRGLEEVAPQRRKSRTNVCRVSESRHESGHLQLQSCKASGEKGVKFVVRRGKGTRTGPLACESPGCFSRPFRASIRAP